jgi:hypothetical protein
LNSGDIVTKGITTLTITLFENLKSFLANDVVRLEGQTLINKGSLKGSKGISYTGESFVSSPTALIKSETLNLTTSTPLETQGTFKITKRAVFSSPNTEQKAKPEVDKGKTEFRGGEFSNQDAMNIDELVYEGKTLNNTGTL